MFGRKSAAAGEGQRYVSQQWTAEEDGFLCVPRVSLQPSESRVGMATFFVASRRYPPQEQNRRQMSDHQWEWDYL